MRNHPSFQSIFDFFDYLFLSTELKVLHLPAGNTDKMVVVITVLTEKIIQFTVWMNNFDDKTALR
jgi:hypothetical protein